MQDIANFDLPAPRRIPWNKGKLTGAKPPLLQKHVWAIRTKLQIEQRTRDLALFNLAIDSKLRAVMSSLSKSRTLRRMVIAPTGRPCVRKRPGDQSGLS